MKVQYIFARLCFDVTMDRRSKIVLKTIVTTKERKKGDIPFVKKCTHAGIRITSQLHFLATVLEEAADHPDAETIYLRCKEEDNFISIYSFWVFLKIINSSKSLILAIARHGLESKCINTQPIRFWLA